MTAFGIGAAYPRDALEIVAARREALAQLLDTFKAVPAVGSRVLLIVLGAELAEVPLEYSMELVAAAGNVLIPYRGRDRDCRAHIIVYERNTLFASDREFVHRSPHNVSHSPDAFSSLRSCEGAGDAYVMQTISEFVLRAFLCDGGAMAQCPEDGHGFLYSLIDGSSEDSRTA